ncbi:DUF732 domain-containing protein [Mycolicibacterium austroafricanum]|uniref:DUF732 domain-containing protein n=1 Tax=Mycolicibacterium austroafricanum TaxID=39687 RepID=A0ABT8HFQ2_MYCAO|nr:DUF732 domain-containing protein [Mycolicibacterium austroafricanum]MDN4519599.1 DUF732 domain-containing protein [Mycolicibacterium austroafricanum]QZT69846.1 DUF732 domain-containing protein [Mycolicibacterium austroafricanum]
MKKIGLLIAGAASALAMAAPAHADTQEFVNYLASRGEVTEGVEFEVIDLGRAICGMFEAGGTVDDVWDTLTQENNAAWIVGSINYLCPDYMYLLN